jgi:hypothetical protein
MPKTIQPPETVTFHLYPLPSDANFHTLNEGDEVNRTNVTDESTDGFLIQADLEKVIHGEGSNLHSFIGLHFLFRGANEKRRFRAVSITIRFEDETRPLKDDPEVTKIWPDSEFTWKKTTTEIQDTQSVEGQVKGGACGATGSLTGRWQRQESRTATSSAKLSGVRTLLERKSGSHKNAVFVRMSEDIRGKSGVFNELRTAILVTRKREGNHRFKAHIRIEVDADFKFNVVRGIKKLVGRSHATDAVIFEPGINHFDEDDIASINNDKPGPEMIQKYGELPQSPQIVQITRKVKKENGIWKEVNDGLQ